MIISWHSWDNKRIQLLQYEWKEKGKDLCKQYGNPKSDKM